MHCMDSHPAATLETTKSVVGAIDLRTEFGPLITAPIGMNPLWLPYHHQLYLEVCTTLFGLVNLKS